MPNTWLLTRNRLCLKTGSYCHFLGKGWHCSVILSFLNDMCLREDIEIDPLVSTLVWCAHNFLGMLYESREENGIWMESADIRQLQLVGDRLLTHLLEANVKYRGFCAYKLYNIRPKVHQFDHLVQLLTLERNPLSSATWMDEDFLRGVMDIGRKCHKRRVQFSALTRYLAGLRLASAMHFKFVYSGFVFFSWQDSSRS